MSFNEPPPGFNHGNYCAPPPQIQNKSQQHQPPQVHYQMPPPINYPCYPPPNYGLPPPLSIPPPNVPQTPHTGYYTKPPVLLNTQYPPPSFNCPPPPPPRSRYPIDTSTIKSSDPNKPQYRSRFSDIKSNQYSTTSSSNYVRSQSVSRHQRGETRSADNASLSRSRSQPPNSNTQRSSRQSNNLSSEREQLLVKWRQNYCETSEEIRRKLAEISNDGSKECWVRSSPADIYYKRLNGSEVEGTNRLDALCTLFNDELMNRCSDVKSKQAPYVPPQQKRKHRVCRHKSEQCSSSSSSDSDCSDDELHLDEEDHTMEELSRKISHPYRLHHDLWYNETGEMNDGPLCRCSAKSRRSGIRHGIYPGENGFPKCDPNSNNSGKLYHYRITISPPTNFLTKTPTIIKHDQHEFIFEGFSLLSHSPIETLPVCKVIRFNIEYTILYVEEKMPENFTIRELDLFFEYLFNELLELIDFHLKPLNTDDENVCSMFHFLPRFVRDLPDNGKEILAMSEVLRYLLDNSGPLVDSETLKEMLLLEQSEWQDYVDFVKGMVVTNPGMKPCSVRIDQLDRNVSDLPESKDTDENGDPVTHPVIVHFGIRPPQLSYAGDPEYQKAWKEYVKFRHLVANMSKPSYEDKRKLEAKENKLQEMRTQGRMKRNVTVAVTSKNFFRTGIMCDIVQHTMLIPVLTCHLRFHRSLDYFEESIGYKFKNRYLLQLALTHPSYKENFGANPDHARNSLTNCGIRQPEYGDRKIHYMNTRKRGINTLINIMSRFGKENETDSNITHNERLEFLGDAVVEFLTSIHLFFMFPELEEGGLATYRAAIVQNQHLAVLARKLHLEEYMLYAHGSDLCHELELRHAMANCFEALMGSLLLDGGIDVADKVFGAALFLEDPNLRDTWENLPPHPLQDQEPFGDRKWIESYELLKTLTKFEETIGVEFRHIRLLARSFTDRSIGFTHLTLGSNQRLEFLGDTVLQLICSEFLYRHFPEHHEGHLSLLRSSLVNNRTQSVVCNDLGMTQYAVYSNPKADLKTKDRADLLEAFLGALYVDQGLEHCQTFCNVCFFPRLQDFIMNQDWNDPKSKLQQCCLTLRTMDGGEPDIPIYKVIECTGPTNTRVYTVAVYFRGTRLSSSTGHSIQQAEMNAAKKALSNSQGLFPQLDHQKRVIAQSIMRRKRKDGDYQTYVPNSNEDMVRGDADDPDMLSMSTMERALLNLPKQYRPRNEDNEMETSDDDRLDTESISSLGSYEEPLSPTKSLKKKKHKKRKKSKSKSERSTSVASSISQTNNSSTIFNDDVENISSTSDEDFYYYNKTTASNENPEPQPILYSLEQENSLICEEISDSENDEINNDSPTYENSVQLFKPIEGTENLSSDLESGEIEDL